MNTKKLWIFGDSFAWGSGTWFNEPYYSAYPEKVSLRYDQIIADRLNLKICNKGIPGASNQEIFLHFCANLPFIKPRDVVLCFLTASSRAPFIYEMGANPRTGPQLRTGTHSVHTLTDTKYNLDEHLDETIREAYLKYITYVKGTEQYDSYEQWKYNLYYTNILSTRSVSGLVINWDFTNGCETIHDCTSGKMKDNHLSWDGHLGFANKILNSIEKGKFIGLDLDVNYFMEELYKDYYENDVPNS